MVKYRQNFLKNAQSQFQKAMVTLVKPTFKKILAIKHGIENFQIHLLGHNFLVEMDMSSFPKMLQFKGKCSHITSYSDSQIGFHNGLTSPNGFGREFHYHFTFKEILALKRKFIICNFCHPSV